MSDEGTIKFYDAKAEDYAALVNNGADAAIDLFLANLEPGSDILDLGCGPGQAAAQMALAGMRVTAVDASIEMVRLASDLPGVTARQARFEDVIEIDAYDGIWASFSLLHARRAEFPGHLGRLHRALKPGGHLFLGMKIGTGEKPDSLGRFYAYYTGAELTGFLGQAGFTVTHSRQYDVRGMTGAMEPAIEIYAHA